MNRFNKATAAAIAGAVGVIVGALWPELGTEVIAAGTTLVATFLVWLVPNKSAIKPVDGSQSGV